MPSLSARLDRIAETIPRTYPGPGGAVAALRNGEVLLRHTWGWANAERRIPFTPRTLFRMCSITKQFTCAVVLDHFPDPSALDADVSARLPLLEHPAPTALHLCHNQSGLRDYWAVAMLHGSPAEAAFGGALVKLDSEREVRDAHSERFEQREIVGRSASAAGSHQGRKRSDARPAGRIRAQEFDHLAR